MSQSEPLNLLRDALMEAQATVRAYDTKAQIVGLGYAFALGIVAGTSDWFPKTDEGQFLAVILFWGVVMAPLVLFGFVLYPTRKTAPEVRSDSAADMRHVLYVDPSRYDTLEALKIAAAECDPLNEVAHELLKVSTLRELKRVRFIRALLTAAGSFVFLSAAQFLWALQVG